MKEMRKINIVTSVIGFAFIGGIYLSGCEEKQTVENGHSDSATSMYSQEKRETEKKETTKADMKAEKENLEKKIESLEKKADEKADKGSKVVKQKFTALKKEVKDYNIDSTKVDAEEGWTRFKLRIETAVDSLEKKI